MADCDYTEEERGREGWRDGGRDGGTEGGRERESEKEDIIVGRAYVLYALYMQQYNLYNSTYTSLL